MTLDQVDARQTRMLKDPDNKRLHSSALGRYQEIRTTRRMIDKALGRTSQELIDAAGQQGCLYLIG